VAGKSDTSFSASSHSSSVPLVRSPPSSGNIREHSRSRASFLPDPLGETNDDGTYEADDDRRTSSAFTRQRSADDWRYISFCITLRSSWCSL
jgi:hypothetical protein